MLAMRRAVEALGVLPTEVLDRRQPLSANCAVPARAIIGGDALRAGDFGGLDPGQDRPGRGNAAASTRYFRTVRPWIATRAMTQRFHRAALEQSWSGTVPSPQFRAGQSPAAASGMSEPKRIASRDNATFKLLRAMAAEPRRHGRTLVDGIHLVTTCLARGIGIRQLLVSEGGQASAEIATLLQGAAGIDCLSLRDSLFRELSGVAAPTGIAAVIDIPQAPAELSPGDAVLLDAVQDAGNVGAILRTAAAAGVRNVLLGPGCAGAWTARALRGGQGAHFFSGHPRAGRSARGAGEPAPRRRWRRSLMAARASMTSISADRYSGWWAMKARACRRNSSPRQNCVPRFRLPPVPNP
jgi:hypothetical protein